MRLSIAATAALLALAWAIPLQTASRAISEDETYDAIIVGGGPAGLSALSGLARVRRKVLLIDSGEYRSGPARHMHDVLGYDGVTGAYFRWKGRQQLSYYDTVNMTNGTVTKIVENDEIFTVMTSLLSGNMTQETAFTAKRIVLATGLRDVLPATPGIQENWGQGLYWCPWCDGYEHVDQAVGLVGPLTSAPGSAREILTQTTQIMAFVNGTDIPAERAKTDASFPGWQTYLSANNITVDNRTISSVTKLRSGVDPTADPSLPSNPEYDLFRIDFTEGPSVERAALMMTNYPIEQRSDVGEEMGVQLYGGRLAADNSKGLVTNIPGVYAIGDANADNATNVPHALYTGKKAAVYLHVDIARDEAAEQIAGQGSRRDLSLDVRDVWKRMNGDPTDRLYAGDFERGLHG